MSLFIPTIDFEAYNEHDDAALDDLASQVSDALTRSGFMKIVNLGITQAQIDHTFELSKWFFSRSEEEKSTSNQDVKVLTTVYAGSNTFTGWDYIVRWLHDPKNKKRRLHIDFIHGVNGIQRYVDLWPDKQKDIPPLITKMFEVYVISIDKDGNKITKKDHFTWDVMNRFEPKKNKIHDQKAA